MRLRVFTKAYNEEAIASAFVRHYRAEGVDEIFVIDHSSTDGTANVLRDLGCTVIVYPRTSSSRYGYATDTKLCNELLDRALNTARGRTWNLFPDVDEFLSTAPGEAPTLRQFLEPVMEADGVGCVGLHCLPREPLDDVAEALDADQFLVRRHDLFPPRSVETPPRSGECWKNIAWQFDERYLARWRHFRYSVGSHVLIGPGMLKMHRPCLVLYHYKVRSIRQSLSRLDDLILHVSSDDPHVVLLSTQRERIASLLRHRGRLLRLARCLGSTEIRALAHAAAGQSEYRSTPYLPPVYGKPQ